MGGGGGFFAPVVNLVGGVVNAVTSAVGAGNVLETPAIAEGKRQAVAQAESRAKTQAAQQQASAQSEGGTPTAYASQQSKSSGSAAALSDSQQSVNQTAGSGTMLTGNAGIDPQSLELGRRTLLGG